MSSPLIKSFAYNPQTTRPTGSLALATGQRSPGGRHRCGAGLRAREQRRLHLGPAGLQCGRQRADRLGRHRDSKCPAVSPPRPSLAGTPASRRSRGPRPTRRCWPHTPRTPRSRPARPRSRAQSSRSSPPCSFPAAAELLTRRPGRAYDLGACSRK